ncbi:MAG: hypothetical protein JW807_16395 [Spirochaetes bacterium]|nr:hypothetical protein [Spirochaetota bacterium]
MKKIRPVIPVALFFAVVSAAVCGKQALRDEDLLLSQHHAADTAAVRRMIDRVALLKKNAPATFAANFSIDGSLAEKKQRILGRASYDRTLRAMHIIFSDAIFRSTVAQFFQEADEIRVYYPVQKKLIVDSFKTFDIGNYSAVSIDFDLLYSLATGTFPLIEDYTVRQGLEANNGGGSMIILENPKFFETVSFRDGNPDKVLILDKKTREKVEIYLKKPTVQGECLFFSNIMIVVQQTRLRLAIQFSGVRLNVPVKVKKAASLKLPANVKTIWM